MSYGIQIWDAAGKLVLDEADRIGRFYGKFSTPTMSHSSMSPITHYTVSVPGFNITDGTWFYVVIDPNDPTAGPRPDYFGFYYPYVNAQADGFDCYVECNFGSATVGPYDIYVWRA